MLCPSRNKVAQSDCHFLGNFVGVIEEKSINIGRKRIRKLVLERNRSKETIAEMWKHGV